MGVKRTADFVEKATWGFAAGLFVLSIVATMLPNTTEAQRQSRIQDQIENTAIDPERLPSYPTSPADQSTEDQPAAPQPEPQQQGN